jgi:hypothetical protein
MSAWASTRLVCRCAPGRDRDRRSRVQEREATGTSLAAIPVIAALGVLVQGLHSRSPSPTGGAWFVIGLLAV